MNKYDFIAHVFIINMFIQNRNDTIMLPLLDSIKLLFLYFLK